MRALTWAVRWECGTPTTGRRHRDRALHRAGIGGVVELDGLEAALPAEVLDDDGTLPALWPRWTQLLPHILAADPAASDDPDLRWTASAAVRAALALATDT